MGVLWRLSAALWLPHTAWALCDDSRTLLLRDLEGDISFGGRSNETGRVCRWHIYPGLRLTGIEFNSTAHFAEGDALFVYSTGSPRWPHHVGHFNANNPVPSSMVLTGSDEATICLLYTSPSPRDRQKSRMPSSA